MANPLYDALFAPHRRSERIFLYLAGGDTLSFRAFLDMSSQYAHALGALGLARGDRIAVQIQKSPRALAIYAAAVQAGLILLPLNTAYRPGEVAYFVQDSGAALMLCDSALQVSGDLVPADHGTPMMTLDADGTGSFANLADSQSKEFAPVNCQPDDLAALLYTSGTTGRSKGAMLSQRNLLSNAATLVKEWHFTANDNLLHALPIYHTHGLFVATNTCLLAGASMIFLPKFDTEQVISELPHASAMMGVPTFYTRLLQHPRFTRELSSHMRVFISGSAPLLADTHTEFQARTGHRILERYGMTETNMNTSNPYEGERKPGTVGPALPDVDVKIADPDTGVELPAGQIGMVEVRGDNVFQGYWKMPDKTAQDLRKNGYFITGDLGQIDDEGYVTIVGRSKDLIISGGFNVYPKEVELVLDDQPDILESAVIGVAHPDFGEAVVAVVVANPGQTVDTDAVRLAAATQLANFKLPKQIVVVDELPRNAMGKVQKNVLRKTYEDIIA